MLILILIGFALGLSFWMSIGKESSVNRVQIIQDGKVIEEYAVDSNYSKTIEVKKNAFHNSIRIENGEVKMISANCPDRLCVHSHPISKNGEMIVCLPHRLYVKLINQEEKDVDVIAN